MLASAPKKNPLEITHSKSSILITVKTIIVHFIKIKQLILGHFKLKKMKNKKQFCLKHLFLLIKFTISFYLLIHQLFPILLKRNIY